MVLLIKLGPHLRIWKLRYDLGNMWPGSVLFTRRKEKDHKKRRRKRTRIRGDNGVGGLGQERGGRFIASSHFFSFFFAAVFACLTWTNIKCETVSWMSFSIKPCLFYKRSYFLKLNFFLFFSLKCVKLKDAFAQPLDNCFQARIKPQPKSCVWERG